MSFRADEDRLNPTPPPDADEYTLGGYQAVYGRAPAFTGADGQPYTVAVETGEHPDGGRAVGWLVFLRWAATGGAIMDHAESGDLVAADSELEARSRLEKMSLHTARRLLDRTVRRRQEGAG
ncbi:MAG: hypothetical protein ACREKN_06950 [Longimicrobiaceae bacterium]